MSKTACIIVAAGRGVRMGGKLPKQFWRLGKRPLIVHTLAAFQGVRQVASIVLVVPSDAIGRTKRWIATYRGWRRTIKVVSGGSTRQESVALGLAAVPSNISYILVHDGVRPFVSRKMIAALIQALRTHRAVVPVCPIADTLKRLSPGGWYVRGTVSRNGLYAVQTPQGFHFSVLRQALEKAKSRGWKVTDEAMMVERSGGRVAVIPGDPINFKITRPGDWELARRWIAGRWQT